LPVTTTLFYRAQAEQQQQAADDAALENVRERCQRASNAWSALARRSERTEDARTHAAANRIENGSGF
jgi:hypothetical protein